MSKTDATTSAGADKEKIKINDANTATLFMLEFHQESLTNKFPVAYICAGQAEPEIRDTLGQNVWALTAYSLNSLNAGQNTYYSALQGAHHFLTENGKYFNVSAGNRSGQELTAAVAEAFQSAS